MKSAGGGVEFEIHMYLAIGKAGEAQGADPGELRPLLIFLRQPLGQAHDFEAAAVVATARGWTDLDFTKAGTLPQDAPESMQPAHRTCYLEALDRGEALMVYPAAVQPARAKA